MRRLKSARPLWSITAKDFRVANYNKLSWLDNKTLRGNASSLALLKESEVAESDLFIAVTASESVNITVSILAKKLGSKKTIARISNTEFINNDEKISFVDIGVDELISPEVLAASEILQLLDQSAFSNSYEV